MAAFEVITEALLPLPKKSAMGVLSAPLHSAFVFDGHHNLEPAEKARTGLLELFESDFERSAHMLANRFGETVSQGLQVHVVYQLQVFGSLFFDVRHSRILALRPLCKFGHHCAEGDSTITPQDT
jgi:hypothetical protein